MDTHTLDYAAPAAPIATSPSEFVVTGRALPGETPAEVFGRMAAELTARDAMVLSLMVYGSLSERRAIERAMHDTFGEALWPITWIEGAGCNGAPLAGAQAFAVSGRSVERIRLGRRAVASVYEDGEVRHCLLGGIAPGSPSPRLEQVKQTLASFETVLDAAGFELRDVVRTWFYNEDILDWYAGFNKVRSARYANVDWRTGSLPASTGIGARNASGAALTLAAWAVRPLDGPLAQSGAYRARVKEVPSPLQCPAPAYGSSFSRAMEIDTGGCKRLLVSGTAGIEPGGNTAWVGDSEKQVGLTMRVVGAILESRGMTFADVTRATAYFPHPRHVGDLSDWLRANKLQAMPVVSTHCVVCRHDLLFEIELDALRAKAP